MNAEDIKILYEKSMSYLDDLRKKSGTKKAGEEQQRIEREKRELYYKESIIPALKALYGFLSEVVEHLNYLEHDIYVNYNLGSIGRLKDLKQANYSLFVDSRDNMTQILLKFTCEKPTPKKFAIEGEKNVARISDYLKTTSLDFQQQNEYDRVHTIVSADFTVKAAIHVGFEFTADIDNSCISLKVKNFEEFGLKARRLQVADVKPEFMDHLARYITHEVDDFFGLDMEDDLKAKIQQNLQIEKQQRAAELQEIEKEAKIEQGKQNEENSNHSVFQILSKFKKD
ncbi:hypothetical protein MNBD_GAMMA22-2246 [hydrothermal vent metagenome]|uniref:Uncharacterized protein n=1 Tax=hydrothermal vent metagenome TaxID=652676 RepID=A0A3B1A6Q0_9ZZZZ